MKLPKPNSTPVIADARSDDEDSGKSAPARGIPASSRDRSKISNGPEKHICSTDTHMTPEEVTSAHNGSHNIELDNVEKQADGISIHPATTNTSQLPLSKARTIALVATLTGAAFLNTLSVQAAVIVLPTIGADLGIPTARQQWIISAYSLAFGCFLLLWGRLADVYGKRLIFIWGSAWVCVVTLLNPFIPNEIGFDIFRGLQGLGAAANVPTAIGILGVTFPPGQAKNYAFAAYSAGAPLGSVFGNILGGIVAEYASWKWIFWILAILAAMVTLAGQLVIPTPAVRDDPEKDLKNAVDWTGGTTITVALFALLFALTEGNIVGWEKPYIGLIIGISLLLIGSFLFWQHHLETATTRPPLLKTSIIRNPQIAAAFFLMAAFFASFNNFLIFATFFYQDYHGLSAIQTTLRFLPTGVAGLMTIVATSQMLARVRVHYTLMFGTACCAVSSLLFAIPISPNTSYWATGFISMCLSVFGADTLFPSLVLFNAQHLAAGDQSQGGAMINAVGQIGRAVGLAIATAIQVAVEDSNEQGVNENHRGNPAFLKSLRAAEWFNVALALAAFVVAAVAFRKAGIVGRR